MDEQQVEVVDGKEKLGRTGGGNDDEIDEVWMRGDGGLRERVGGGRERVCGCVRGVWKLFL